MSWESVIGLELHVQLATQSKIFSGASTEFGAEPNTQACAIDLGLPGVLPVLNQEALRMAVLFGLAIGAKVHQHSVFDRKNYFYPDLPKGYQISQFEHPIVGRGELTIVAADGTEKIIGVTRAHLEEDAGKSLHEAFAGLTGVDLNRSGTPLLEIVSEPDLRSAADAVAYFRKMHNIVRYLGICDGNLNEGNMRCDANVSVRKLGASEYGERTEVKNINSFRFVEQAINYEIARQIEVLEKGGTIVRETRLYDPDRDETRSMRSKELSDDYRYFPDPDLLPVIIEPSWIDAIRDTMPELEDAKRNRYLQDFALEDDSVRFLVSDPNIAAYFDALTDLGCNPKLAANWLMGEVSAALNQAELAFDQCPVVPKHLRALIGRIEDGTISSKIAKNIFKTLWDNPVSQDTSAVDQIIESEGLKQVSDSDKLQTMIDQIIADNPSQVEQFKAGKDKVFGYFVGQVMQLTQGKANPKQVSELLRKSLG